MSKPDQTPPPAPDEPPDRDHDFDRRPIPDSVLAIFLAILAVALVLGYLLLNKMADMSREEDCMLAHRANCAD
jgi:hypothetical protein